MPGERSIISPIIIVGSALILYWVYRDSRARDAYPPFWFAAIGFSGLFIHFLAVPLGALIYIMVRPKGRLMPCPHCGAPRLATLTECPKCEGPLKKECYRCHAAIPVEATECPECGSRS